MSPQDSIKDQTEGILAPLDDDLQRYPNRFRCKKCGTLCVSRFRHDFAACPCGNYVDGGNAYARAGGNFEDMEFNVDQQLIPSGAVEEEEEHNGEA